MSKDYLNKEESQQRISHGPAARSSSNTNAPSLMPPTFNLQSNNVIQRVETEEKKKWVQSETGWKNVNKSDIKEQQQWQKVDGKWTQGAKPKLAPLKLPEKYKDEDKKTGWRARPGSKAAEGDKVTTDYFTPEKFHDESELVPDEQGNLSTRAGHSHNTSSQIYAMNPEGKLGINHLYNDRQIDDQGKTKGIHHSSIFAGGDVMHAGHMGLDDGKVDYLDDDSGHYMPDEKHTYHAYKKLKKAGHLADKGEVGMVNKNAKSKGDAAWWDDKLKLSFSQYEQAKGNESQARNKQKMLAELDSTHKAPEEGNAVPVPFNPNYIESSGKEGSYGTKVEQQPVEEDDFYEDESSEDLFMPLYPPEGRQNMLYPPENGGGSLYPPYPQNNGGGSLYPSYPQNNGEGGSLYPPNQEEATNDVSKYFVNNYAEEQDEGSKYFTEGINYPSNYLEDEY